MPKKIVDKAKRILYGVVFDFDLAFDWYNENFDNYYQYFSHPDDEVRKYSLLIFAGGLGNWHLESALPFRPIEQQVTDGDFDKDKVYHFEDYVKSFLEHRVAIKQEFPLLFNRIIWYLLRLDNRKPFDTVFTFADKQLLNKLRYVLNESGSDVNNIKKIMRTS